MTGYGSASVLYENREITAEIRSVNNRYLDCSVKLPRSFSFAEDAVKQTVKQYISRGKVDVFLTVASRDGENTKITVNRTVLEGYLAAFRQISEEYGVQNDVTVSALSRLPDLFVAEKAEEDEDELLSQILSAVTQALAKFNAMREKEGAALAADLRAKGEGILEMVARVEQRSPVTLAEYRERLTAKMQEVLSSVTVDEGRILQEAAIYADRIAVDEETVRLRSHLAQMDTMLSEGGPIGRKLDFLMQEMNRETNTIGSKGNDLEQARTVVEMKSELEKIREQIQNIE